MGTTKSHQAITQLGYTAYVQDKKDQAKTPLLTTSVDPNHAAKPQVTGVGTTKLLPLSQPLMARLVILSIILNYLLNCAATSH